MVTKDAGQTTGLLSPSEQNSRLMLQIFAREIGTIICLSTFKNLETRRDASDSMVPLQEVSLPDITTLLGRKKVSLSEFRGTGES